MPKSERGNFFTWSPRKGDAAYSVYFEASGKGRRHVLLVHGLGGNGFTFRHLAPALASLGYRVWVLDLLGFGKSSKPLDAPYSFQFFSRLVDAFMQHHKIHTAHFIGHSMGGGVGLVLAHRHPKKILSLSLIAAAGLPLKIPASVFSPLRIMTRLPSALIRPVVREVLHWLVYEPKVVTEEMLDAYFIPLEKEPGPAILFAVLRAFKQEALERLADDLPEIQTPTFVLWGREDKLIPVSHARQFGVDLPNVKVHVMDECGHLPQEENPETTIGLLTEFLKENKQGLLKSYLGKFFPQKQLKQEAS